LHKAEAEFARRLLPARESTAANTARAADPKVLHPGVARYLQEARITR
jgi:hypothetical protein